MKGYIKKLLREGLINENTELINSILDKISDSGYDSLTDYEKKVLDAESKGKNEYTSLEDDINSFLNERLSDLDIQPYKRGFLNTGKMFGFYFIDADRDLKMDLQLYHTAKNSNVINTRYVLFIDDNLDNELEAKYNLTNEKQKEYIINWFNYSEYISKMKNNDELKLPKNFTLKDVSSAWF